MKHREINLIEVAEAIGGKAETRFHWIRFPVPTPMFYLPWWLRSWSHIVTYSFTCLQKELREGRQGRKKEERTGEGGAGKNSERRIGVKCQEGKGEYKW